MDELIADLSNEFQEQYRYIDELRPKKTREMALAVQNDVVESVSRCLAKRTEYTEEVLNRLFKAR
jgi:hypothetical protein